MKKTLFVLALALFALCPQPSMADLTAIGECGGMTWYDDPSLAWRVHLAFPDGSSGDLATLGATAQALADSCQRVICFQIITDVDANVECAVILAMVIPGCNPGGTIKGISRVAVDDPYQYSSIGTERLQRPAPPSAPRE